MIFETIVSTLNTNGQPHVTPFGIRYENELVIISPYKPSTTLDNIIATKCATVNFTDDVRVFAGALTQHQSLDLTPTDQINGLRLKHTLTHKELKLVNIKEDELRPQLYMEVVHQVQHQPFQGFNRAQAAVIELAVLASRLHLIKPDKVKSEMQYLQIAIDKTAGERELQACGWLTEKIENFYAEQSGANLA